MIAIVSLLAIWWISEVIDLCTFIVGLIFNGLHSLSYTQNEFAIASIYEIYSNQVCT
ncbi:MAG: hypothetical protein RR328_06450 [Bacteroidales bacterium]